MVREAAFQPRSTPTPETLGQPERPKKPYLCCRQRLGCGPLRHLQLDLGIHLRILAGLLVALLQMLHEYCHHHIDQHKLGDQHEGDKVDR